MTMTSDGHKEWESASERHAAGAVDILMQCAREELGNPLSDVF